MKKTGQQQGFTLIELLVVITIISILAALLAPGIASAKRKSYSANCMNNLKQIGLATQMYWDDNNGKLQGLSGYFPTWTNPVPPYAWTQVLFPYTQSTKVYLESTWPNYMPPLPVNYYFNLLPACVTTNTSVSTGAYAVDSRAMENASGFVMMSEDLYSLPQQEIDPTDETSDRTGFSGTDVCFPPIHSGFCNFVFGDGHVGSYAYYDPSMTWWYHGFADWQTTAPP